MNKWLFLTIIIIACAVAFQTGRHVERRAQATEKLQHFQMLGYVCRDSQSNIVTRLQSQDTRDATIRNLAVFASSCEATTADVRLITLALAKAIATEKAEWPSNLVAQAEKDMREFKK